MTTTVDHPTRARDAIVELDELCGVVLQERYALERMLGRGGMGAVFVARDQRLDREVAVKVMRPVLAVDTAYVARFLREARAASKIRHRNVVMVLDYGETEGHVVFSVMELLQGQDLEAVLRARPGQRMTWAEACDLLVQVASGLHAAHSQGVVHRDIKPANCLLTEEDGEPVVKLLDFGIAKLEDTEKTDKLTGTGDVLGTPSYIAPELVRTHSRGSPRSDIYSLGVLAYRMLTGKVPFTAETRFEVMRRACMDPVPPLRDAVPTVPAAVEEYVLQMMAKEPEQRPADMQAVRQRLSALRGEKVRRPAAKPASLGGSMLRKLSSELPKLQGSAMQLLSQHITPAKGGKASLPRKVLAPIEGLDRAVRRSTREAAKVLEEMQAVLQGDTGEEAVPPEAEADLTSEEALDGLQTTVAVEEGRREGREAGVEPSLVSEAEIDTAPARESSGGSGELEPTVSLDGAAVVREIDAEDEDGAKKAAPAVDVASTAEAPRRSSPSLLLVLLGVATLGLAAAYLLGG